MKTQPQVSRGMQRTVSWVSVLTMAAGLAACSGGTPKDQEPLSSPTFERALVFLQTQAHSTDPVVRANCIEALQASHDPRALETIEEGLHDKDGGVRFVAAMAAGERKAQSLRPVLNTLVTTDSDPNVRVGCIFALRRLGDKAHWGELGAAMESPNPDVRANTALAVGIFGDAADQVLLQHYRDDPVARVRMAIATALARMGNADAQQVIVSESVNKFAEDQYNAMEACAYLPPEVAINPLLLGLQGPGASGGGTATAPAGAAGGASGASAELITRRQLIAARSLAKLRNGSGSKIALENLNNPDPSLRALAALALGEMLTSRQAPGLEPLLADPDDGVKRAAAAAVVNIYARAGNK